MYNFDQRVRYGFDHFSPGKKPYCIIPTCAKLVRSGQLQLGGGGGGGGGGGESIV